jgi:hypothetical protein
MKVIAKALDVAKERFGMRVTHLSVQGNHLHLIVEAACEKSLARGMQGLKVRLAKGLNRLMGRTGPVFDGRYFSRPLPSPRSVRSVIRYVIDNRRIHLERLGEEVDPGAVDHDCSAWPGAETPGYASRPLVVPPWGRLLRLASAAWLQRPWGRPAPAPAPTFGCAAHARGSPLLIPP